MSTAALSGRRCRARLLLRGRRPKILSAACNPPIVAGLCGYDRTRTKHSRKKFVALRASDEVALRISTKEIRTTVRLRRRQMPGEQRRKQEKCDTLSQDRNSAAIRGTAARLCAIS